MTDNTKTNASEKYETFSTTADVGIRFQGKGIHGLFNAALKAINLLYFEKADFNHSINHSINNPINTNNSIHSFDFHGDGLENLLVNFLSEIVFLLQDKQQATQYISIKHADHLHINADLFTIPIDNHPHLQPELEIKSVTYHNLHVTQQDELFKAEVVFDI